MEPCPKTIPFSNVNETTLTPCPEHFGRFPAWWERAPALRCCSAMSGPSGLCPPADSACHGRPSHHAPASGIFLSQVPASSSHIRTFATVSCFECSFPFSLQGHQTCSCHSCPSLNITFWEAVSDPLLLQFPSRLPYFFRSPYHSLKWLSTLVLLSVISPECNI